jgi:hypothetical protein
MPGARAAGRANRAAQPEQFVARIQHLSQIRGFVIRNAAAATSHSAKIGD